jgi:hypothetical protein
MKKNIVARCLIGILGIVTLINLFYSGSSSNSNHILTGVLTIVIILYWVVNKNKEK